MKRKLMTCNQTEYILKNYTKNTMTQLAKDLNIPFATVRSFIFRNGLKPFKPKKSRIELTKGELRILKYLCLLDIDICDILKLSYSTVKTHTSNIFIKLGVHNKASAIIVAIKKQLISIDDLVMSRI